MESSNLLKIGSLITVGHYNSIISREQGWGSKCRSDSLVDRLLSLFEENHLVDICHVPIEPTWHNMRSGGEYIGKRLDKFMVHENLIELFGNLRSRVEKTFVSNDYLIVLQWQAEML